MISQKTIPLIIGPVTAVAMRLASEPTADISYLLLAIYALFGRVQAIQALALSWLFTMISPGIAPLASLGALGRYTIIFSAAISVFLRFRPARYQTSEKQLLFSTMALSAFFLVHSLLFSAIPDVSVLKVISWTLTVTTLFAAWGGLNADQRDALIHQLFKGLTLVLIVSLPLIVMPLGYLRNAHGFQGILNHPQAFGTTIALLGIWVAAGLLTLSRPPWRLVLFTGACVILIFMSEARTAGFALVGGIVSSVMVTVLLSKQRIAVLYPGLRNPRVILVIVCSLFLAIVFAPKLVDSLDTYVSKRSNVQGILAAYENSRGRLIEDMWRNIEKRPMTGIGFGIASNPSTMRVTRDPIFNLPVGASIEKGVLPLAIVEEVGVIGFLLVLLWGWGILRRALKGGGAAVGLLATIILLNFGESTFFSVGGMGMLPLVFLGWIATSGKRKRVGNIA